MPREVRLSDRDCDFAPWYIEKACTVLECLAHSYALLRAANITEQEPKEQLETHYYIAIHNQTKLLAMSCGASWDTNDASIILEHGHDGYEIILKKYGLIELTKRERSRIEKYERYQRYIENLRRIEKYLTGPRAPNRTLIDELLMDISDKHILLRKLKNQTEALAMGHKSWLNYIEEVSPILDELINHYKRVAQ